MTATAGARRTDSTLSRAVRDERVPDLLVNPDNSDGRPAFTRAYAQIDKIKTPGIRAIATLNAVAAGPVNADGIVDLDGLDNESAMTPTDGAMFHTVDRGDVVAGRYPDVNNAAEVMINEAKARRDHIRVGDTMRLGVMAVDDIDTKHPDSAAPSAVHRRLSRRRHRARSRRGDPRQE